MTRYSSPFREGDDATLWLHTELPTWVIHPETPGLYRAASPTYAIDGITISAHDPVELVERVRAFERMVALAAGFGGRLPVGRPLGGKVIDPKAAPQARAPFVPAPHSAISDPTSLGAPEGPAAVEAAKSRGYSGTPCTSCGSLHTRYSGTCLVCDNCGATSGCS